MTENKKDILNSFCSTLKKTRKYYDLEEIKYLEENGMEYAILCYKNGKKWINISGDSGYGMIQDIINNYK